MTLDHSFIYLEEHVAREFVGHKIPYIFTSLLPRHIVFVADLQVRCLGYWQLRFGTIHSMQATYQLSLVIPVFNESEVLPILAARLNELVEKFTPYYVPVGSRGTTHFPFDKLNGGALI